MDARCAEIEEVLEAELGDDLEAVFIGEGGEMDKQQHFRTDLVAALV